MTDKFVHQFKTMEDLREIIKQYELFYARPTPSGSHPTLYRKRDVPEDDRLVHGLRAKDWELAADVAGNQVWVLPNDQRGLSFSAQWQHLKGKFKMKENHYPNSPINVYWVLQTAEIPEKLKFVVDRKDSKHFLLTVTEKMTIWELISKLKWVARQMSVMRDARRAL